MAESADEQQCAGASSRTPGIYAPSPLSQAALGVDEVWHCCICQEGMSLEAGRLRGPQTTCGHVAVTPQPTKCSGFRVQEVGVPHPAWPNPLQRCSNCILRMHFAACACGGCAASR